MANNTERIIDRMQSSFPQTYNVYDKNTVLYALLSVFGSKYGAHTDTIDRLYAMIGIDSTYDKDLEYRWGSLLGINKQLNESYNDYRNRLKIVYSSLNGGTAEAIKYAIASAAGIESESDIINDYIHVYDAWEYPGDIDPKSFGLDEIVDETSLYGCIVCTVDLVGINSELEHYKVMEAINNTKASGINPYLLFLYGTIEELSALRRTDEQIYNVIRYETNEDGAFINTVCNAALGVCTFGQAILGVAFVAPDDFEDVIKYDAYDHGVLTNVSDMWSTLGTNSTIINESLITNMYVESDECTDIVII